MDTELFELCKEVYKRTGWHGLHYEFDDKGWVVQTMAMRREDELDKYTPLYTSDYLLEKLPAGTILRRNGSNAVASTKSRWVQEAKAWGQTPLKALLRLTLALKDAGEL